MARRSTDPDDYQRVAPPVAAMAKEFHDGAEVAPHRHIRAQLVYAVNGVMRVGTEAAAWVVPPLRAVWIPAGIRHQHRMVGDVAMRTLYIAPDAAPWLWPDCRVIEVSSLLKELILSVLDEPVEYDLRGRGGLISRLILEELQRAPLVPMRIPMPADPRLLAVCQALLDRPDSTAALETWAEQAGASSRTLARRFRQETGLSFGAWRQQARLAEAVCRLALGRPVSQIAYELGYRSPSAFTAMFRRALGQAPQRYYDRAPPPA